MSEHCSRRSIRSFRLRRIWVVLLLPWLGTNFVFIPVLGPVCWYLLRCKRPDLAMTIAVVTIGDYLVGTALKVSFERPSKGSAAANTLARRIRADTRWLSPRDRLHRSALLRRTRRRVAAGCLVDVADLHVLLATLSRCPLAHGHHWRAIGRSRVAPWRPVGPPRERRCKRGVRVRNRIRRLAGPRTKDISSP